MRHRKTERGYLVRLERGEEVHESLAAFVREQGIGAASVQGIGALQDCELGYFDRETGAYERSLFPASMELLQLAGNVAWDGDEPILHLHAVLAGPELVARGGHLFRGVVSVTGEIFLEVFGERLSRALDADLGLKLLEL